MKLRKITQWILIAFFGLAAIAQVVKNAEPLPTPRDLELTITQVMNVRVVDGPEAQCAKLVEWRRELKIPKGVDQIYFFQEEEADAPFAAFIDVATNAVCWNQGYTPGVPLVAESHRSADRVLALGRFNLTLYVMLDIDPSNLPSGGSV